MSQPLRRKPLPSTGIELLVTSGNSPWGGHRRPTQSTHRLQAAACGCRRAAGLPGQQYLAARFADSTPQAQVILLQEDLRIYQPFIPHSSALK